MGKKKAYRMFLKLLDVSIRKARGFGLHLGFRHYELSSDYQNTTAELAIVVQGPYVKLGRFTLTMLNYYRSTFPNAVIVYSTTSNLPVKDYIFLLETLKVSVVTPNCDIHPGPFNFNFQLLTTKSGLNQIKNNNQNIKFVLKTRSDQILLNGKFFEYFRMLIERYPLSKDRLGQRGRLLFSSLNSFQSRLYGLSDMLIFGYLDDVISYFDCEYDERTTSELQNVTHRSLEDHSRLEVCEVRLAVEFLKAKGEKLQYTIEDSKAKIGSRFIVIDHEMVDQYWCKYTAQIDRYKSMGRYERICHLDWISFQND